MDPDYATMYTSDDPAPAAVWPVWSATGDSIEKLIRLMKNPWGEDKKLCNEMGLPIQKRPVFGQRHLIVITDLPQMQKSC